MNSKFLNAISTKNLIRPIDISSSAPKSTTSNFTITFFKNKKILIEKHNFFNQFLSFNLK